LWGEQADRKHFDLGRCSIHNTDIYIVYSPFGDSENRGTNLLNEFTFRHTELAISDAIYKIMIIILKIMLNINQSISIQCLRKTGGNNSIFSPMIIA
jgi:3-dehydroquinate dehydratase